VTAAQAANAADAGLAIVAQGVTKRYAGATAVDRLSLEVRRGEVFCLLGPNGSGKSTFIRMLAGYISPTGGRLFLAGHDVVRERRAAQRRLGYAPESVPLYRHMRVGEFIEFMARLRGAPAAAAREAAARVASRLSLDDVMRKPVAALSRGYRQRLALAQALVHDPEVLILDEPTNGLDPRQIIEVRTLIRELARRHTVLMSSHVLSEVEKTADRVAILLQGRLLGVREVASAPDLESWFLSLA
jgi:ABC-2 type transport system ATP-binding protein